jgi:hypothetical protein
MRDKRTSLGKAGVCISICKCVLAPFYTDLYLGSCLSNWCRNNLLSNNFSVQTIICLSRIFSAFFRLEG